MKFWVFIVLVLVAGCSNKHVKTAKQQQAEQITCEGILIAAMPVDYDGYRERRDGTKMWHFEMLGGEWCRVYVNPQDKWPLQKYVKIIAGNSNKDFHYVVEVPDETLLEFERSLQEVVPVQKGE